MPVAEWWQVTELAELTPAQWDALCDGCGKCCLHKLEDEDSAEIVYTSVHCRLLDAQACRCKNYTQRQTLVPMCVDLREADMDDLQWLPATCAYRLRANGQQLPDWHYLVSGDRETVHTVGVSVRGRVICEDHVHPDGYDEYIVQWVDQENSRVR